MLDTRTCQICDREFFTKRREAKACSEECRKEWQRRQAQEAARRFKEKRGLNWIPKDLECRTCDIQFKQSSNNQVYCSVECRDRFYSMDFLVNNLHRLESGEIKIQSAVLTFLKMRVLVMDRDGFTCQYCGRNPRKDIEVLLHVDHKIPKKHGGSDDMSNLITACQECNLGKSDVLLNLWKLKKEGKYKHK